MTSLARSKKSSRVDQTDADVLRDEITEYVVTDAIRSHFNSIYEAYSETPNKPHEGNAIWISGFFGSGKSSFAKMVGLTIDNRDVAGEPAASRFAKRVDDQKLKVLLNTINEKIPTHAVIFDVSTDRGIRSGNQTLTEIMHGLLLQSLGYAKDLDLSELEITLEGANKLEAFEAEYRRLFPRAARLGASLEKCWGRRDCRAHGPIWEASRPKRAAWSAQVGLCSDGRRVMCVPM